MSSLQLATFQPLAWPAYPVPCAGQGHSPFRAPSPLCKWAGGLGMRVSEGLGRGLMVEKVKVSPPSSLLPVLGRWVLAPVSGEPP